MLITYRTKMKLRSCLKKGGINSTNEFGNFRPNGFPLLRANQDEGGGICKPGGLHSPHTMFVTTCNRCFNAIRLALDLFSDRLGDSSAMCN